MRIHHLNCVSTCPLGGALMDGRSFMRFYQWMMEKDRGRRLASQARLRALRARPAEPVAIICGHDLDEFERIACKPAAERRSVTQGTPWKKRWQA